MREIKFEYVSRAVRDVPPTPFNNLPIRKGDTRRNIYTLDEIQAGTIHLHHQDTKGDVFELVARREYTGLKGKNGVEIYEGDIITAPMYDYNVIKFYNGCFIIDFDEYYEHHDWLYMHHTAVEVVGNIYEHSHLLEAN